MRCVLCAVMTCLRYMSLSATRTGAPIPRNRACFRVASTAFARMHCNLLYLQNNDGNGKQFGLKIPLSSQLLMLTFLSFHLYSGVRQRGRLLSLHKQASKRWLCVLLPSKWLWYHWLTAQQVKRSPRDIQEIQEIQSPWAYSSCIMLEARRSSRLYAPNILNIARIANCKLRYTCNEISRRTLQ